MSVKRCTDATLGRLDQDALRERMPERSSFDVQRVPAAFDDKSGQWIYWPQHRLATHDLFVLHKTYDPVTAQQGCKAEPAMTRLDGDWYDTILLSTGDVVLYANELTRRS